MRAHKWMMQGPSNIVALADCCSVCGLRSFVMYDKGRSRKLVKRHGVAYWRMPGMKYTSDTRFFPEECPERKKQLNLFAW
jgi:hypothetical protein